MGIARKHATNLIHTKVFLIQDAIVYTLLDVFSPGTKTPPIIDGRCDKTAQVLSHYHPPAIGAKTKSSHLLMSLLEGKELKNTLKLTDPVSKAKGDYLSKTANS